MSAVWCCRLARFCSEIQPSDRQDLETILQQWRCRSRKYPTFPKYDFLYLSSLKQGPGAMGSPKSQGQKLSCPCCCGAVILEHSTFFRGWGFALSLVLIVIHKFNILIAAFSMTDKFASFERNLGLKGHNGLMNNPANLFNLFLYTDQQPVYRGFVHLSQKTWEQ